MFPTSLPAARCVVPLGGIREDRKAASGGLAKYRRVQTEREERGRNQWERDTERERGERIRERSKPSQPW